MLAICWRCSVLFGCCAITEDYTVVCCWILYSLSYDIRCNFALGAVMWRWRCIVIFQIVLKSLEKRSSVNGRADALGLVYILLDALGLPNNKILRNVMFLWPVPYCIPYHFDNDVRCWKSIFCHSFWQLNFHTWHFVRWWYRMRRWW